MARPLFLATLAFFGGLALGPSVNPPLAIPFAGVLLPGLIWIALVSRDANAPQTRGLLLLLALAFSLGLLRYEWAESVTLDRARTILQLNGDRPLTLAGKIGGEVRDATAPVRFVLADAVAGSGDDWTRLGFDVQVTCRFTPDAPLRTGDGVLVDGRLEPVRAAALPGQPDYATHLAARGILAEMTVFDPDQLRTATRALTVADRIQRRLEAGRRRVLDGLAETLPPEEASLLAAMLLGERSDLPGPARRLLIETGVYHITAVSGLHITAIALILAVSGKLLFLKRRPSALLAIPLLLAFQCLIGWRYPALRATTMGVALMAGRWLRRDTDSLASLSLAALGLAFIAPLSAYQAGFQLSFLICLGIVLGMQRFNEMGIAAFAARTRWPLRPLALGFFVSVSAFLFGAPVIAWHFQTLTPAAVLVNPLASLFIVAIMAAGLVQAILILAAPPLAVVAGFVSSLLIKALVAVAGFFHGLPGGHVEIMRPPILAVAAAYLLLLVLFTGRRSFPLTAGRFALRRHQAVLAALAALVWALLLQPGHDELRVEFLSIGQGDCVVFRLPNGVTILSDGGPSYVTTGRPWSETPLGRYFRTEGIRRIDVAIASHPQDDHIGGLIDALEHMPVHTVIDAGVRLDSATSRRFEAAIQASGAQRRTVLQGDRLEGLMPGLTLDFLYPTVSALTAIEDANEASVVTMVRYGEVDFFLTGDIGATLERDLVDLGPAIDCEILKVAHHGSRYSSTEAFLRAASPDVSVICVGRNAYGHPDPLTVRRLRRHSALVYRTDHDGTVRVTTDGKRYRVSGLLDGPVHAN